MPQCRIGKCACRVLARALKRPTSTPASPFKYLAFVFKNKAHGQASQPNNLGLLINKAS
jgi:hypothetical protein